MVIVECPVEACTYITKHANSATAREHLVIHLRSFKQKGLYSQLRSENAVSARIELYNAHVKYDASSLYSSRNRSKAPPAESNPHEQERTSRVAALRKLLSPAMLKAPRKSPLQSAIYRATIALASKPIPTDQPLFYHPLMYHTLCFHLHFFCDVSIPPDLPGSERDEDKIDAHPGLGGLVRLINERWIDGFQKFREVRWSIHTLSLLGHYPYMLVLDLEAGKSCPKRLDPSYPYTLFSRFVNTWRNRLSNRPACYTSWQREVSTLDYC